MAINIITTNMADQFAHWASDAVIADVASGIGFADAVVEYAAAGATLHHVVEGISWSYDGVPTNGSLRIEDGITLVFEVDVVAAGPGYVPVRKRGSANTALTITLAGGGGAVGCRLNIIGHRLD